MSTPEMVMQEWRDIPWPEVEKDVHCLQRRIYRASLNVDRDLVHRLQRLLMSSRSAKLLSVRRVTQDNQGKKTAGIDGIACLEPEDRLLLVENLSLDAKPQPLRRVRIPKPGTDEQRPLGIPTMYDRALQALVKLALEPEWEAKFEPNSYGFRPGRSAHDAIEAIFHAVKGMAKHVLDADIAKCFDRINHQALLDKLQTFPRMQRAIKAWLETGVLDGDTLFPTEQGTPQGGVISPLLANVALHGLETEVRSHFQRTKMFRTERGRINHQWQPAVIRYADDFVVIHQDEGVVKECQTIIQEWLKGMGLELKPSKTRLAHTLKEVDGKCGFDFLGFTIRQFPLGKYRSGKTSKGKPRGFKTIIKPSKEKVILHQKKLSEMVQEHKSKSQKDLLRVLSGNIKGWCDYYKTVCSSSTFQNIDGVLHNMLLRWARRRHPKKSTRWVIGRYWLMPKWIFGLKSGRLTLRTHSMTKIQRHVKVKGEKCPFDGDWTYWASRQAYYPGVSYWLARILKRQKGKCKHCGMIFMPDDLIECHHQLDESGQRNGLLDALHRHCHDQVHGPRKVVKQEGSTNDKD